MHTYLIIYGADSEMATFQADDVEHAIEQFVDWALHQNIATLGELLSYAYDNSEGSLTKHDFKMKGAS